MLSEQTYVEGLVRAWGFSGFVHAFEKRLPGARIAFVVVRQVAHGDIEKSLHRTTGIDGRASIPEADERILHDIAGRVLIDGKPSCVPEQAWVEGAE